MSASSVARLQHEEEAPATPAAPALGMSLQVDLGAGRVCTLQTFVAADCSLPTLNRMLDKMTSAGARQRAAYKIEELERDLEKLLKEQEQHQEDLDNIDAEYVAAQAKRETDASKALTAADTYMARAKEAAEARGVRNFDLKKGSREEQHVSQIRNGVEKLKGEMVVAKNEHDHAHTESKKTMERRAALIVKNRAEIAHCQEVVAAGLKE